MQKIIFSTVILLLLIGAIWLYKGPLQQKNPFLPSATATIDNHLFHLLIAKSPKEVQTGLSDKTSLPKDEGMIFIFNGADYYPFWMKKMKFPIDIIYIRGSHVVTVFQNVQPPQNPDDSNLPIYKPDETADKVLEINTGLSSEYGIKKGDTVEFKNL